MNELRVCGDADNFGGLDLLRQSGPQIVRSNLLSKQINIKTLTNISLERFTHNTALSKVSFIQNELSKVSFPSA